MSYILDLRGHDAVKRTAVLLDPAGRPAGTQTVEVSDIDVQTTLGKAMDMLHVDGPIDHPRLWRVYWWAKAELERN